MVSTRWPWFSFMCNTTMFIQPQDKTTATTGAGDNNGGGWGDRRPTSWFICPKLDTAVWKITFKGWRCPQTTITTKMLDRPSYRPVATRRAALQA